jgi:hypothetical protein
MPPSGLDKVASLNHLKNGWTFSLVFCVVPGKALIQLHRWRIFTHGGISSAEPEDTRPLLPLLHPVRISCPPESNDRLIFYQHDNKAGKLYNSGVMRGKKRFQKRQTARDSL